MNVLREIEMNRYPWIKEGADPEWCLEPEDEAYFRKELLFVDTVIPTLEIRMKYTPKGKRYFILKIYDPGAGKNNKDTYIMFGPGYRLPEEEEERLEQYCFYEWVMMTGKNIKKIVKNLNKTAPELQIQFCEGEPERTILQLYYTGFPCIQEMLYKARLYWLGLYIKEVDSFNMVATKPSDVFENISLRALRLFNNEWSIHALLTEEKRNQVSAVLSRYSRFLGGYKKISASQYEYLKDTYENEGEPEKNVFRFLAVDEFGNLYADYVNYREKAAFLNDPEHCPLDIKSVSELYRCSMEADYRLMYQEHRSEMDHKMHRQSRRLCYLDLDDARYPFLVTHPICVEDIINEAHGQRNCLNTKINNIAEGRSDVGFFRKRDEPEKSFVTFEVRNGRVVQLLGRFNERLDQNCDLYGEAYEWFSDVYMKVKGFTMLAYDDYE